MSHLFRDEVSKAKQLEWLGTVSIAVPPSQRFLTLSVACVLLLLLSVLLFGHYQRHDYIRGVLTYSYPPISVISPVDGHLARQAVDVGANVSEGQPIAYISTDFLHKDTVITAPQDGQLISVDTHVGEAIARGQLVFRMRTRGSHLIALFPIAGRDVGFITPGSTIRLRYPAFPFQKYGAAAGVIQALEINRSLEPGDHPYEVIVTLPRYDVSLGGHRTPLTQGLAVETDIALERRTLWGWLLHSNNTED